MLELEQEVTPTSVTVNSATNGTVVEVRSATSPTATLDQTTALGTGTVTNGTATIPLTNAPKSKYLLVFVTQMSPTSDKQFQSKINEITRPGQLTSPGAVATAGCRPRRRLADRDSLSVGCVDTVGRRSRRDPFDSQLITRR